jgi:hypothetical protein
MPLFCMHVSSLPVDSIIGLSSELMSMAANSLLHGKADWEAAHQPSFPDFCKPPYPSGLAVQVQPRRRCPGAPSQ